MSETCNHCNKQLDPSERQHRVALDGGSRYFHAARDSACSHAAFKLYKRRGDSIRLLETFTDRR